MTVTDAINTTPTASGTANLPVIQELKELGISIRELRGEISKLQNESSKHFEFGGAHDELDSVVETTSQATNDILDRAEQIAALRPHFEESAVAVIDDSIQRLYEACTFQDLTGQRIDKVMRIIHVIESELEKIFKNYSVLMGTTQSIQSDPKAKADLNYQIIKELYALSVKISQTKKEIAEIKSAKNNQFQFSVAKDELEEIATAASNATHIILTCAENMEKLKSKLMPEYQPALIKAVTTIYESCAFHDLIGQRISKVMKSLSHIDLALQRIFSEYVNAAVDVNLEDAFVLENGPQLPSKAPTQDIIDDLFSKL